MKFSVLIPHFKSKITAYSVYQFLEQSKEYGVDIIVINNSFPDESIKCLDPFGDKIKVIDYFTDKIGSHGIALDYAMKFVKTEYVICAESDSFPVVPFVEYYETLIQQGYDCAGSHLMLSGGFYMHPCGALYSKKLWQEAKDYCDKIEYKYFPNASMREGFDCHLMVHNSILDKFLEAPNDYVELPKSYYRSDINVGMTKAGFLRKAEYYSAVVCPFHNGMGRVSESIKTYGQRNLETEVSNILLDNKRKLINRIGYEPGQWLTYFAYATNKKIANIPTEIKWLPNRENQQQEYTKMENGFVHIWCGSSYLSMKDTQMNDVYEFKKNQIKELYNSLPKNLKIDK